MCKCENPDCGPVPGVERLLATSHTATLNVPTCWFTLWTLLVQLEDYKETPNEIRCAVREFAHSVILMLGTIKPTSFLNWRVIPRESALVDIPIIPGTIYYELWQGLALNQGWPENMRRYLRAWKDSYPDQAKYGSGLLDLLRKRSAQT